MKFLICLLVIPSAALLSNSGFADQFIDPKAPHDAGAVMQKLNGMVAFAQQKLSIAERHHKKLVKKVRKDADALYEEEAKVYGEALNRFSADRARAEADLDAVIRVGKAGLAQAEAAAANSKDWRDPEVAQRAKLGAQLASADRISKKNERHRLRQVREGEEGAEETIEDNAQKLGMKLGDMTPVVDKAKKTLEAVAEKKVDVPKENVTTVDVPKKVNLTSLQNSLEEASKKSQAVTADANKKLDGFLSKTGKDVAAKTVKLQENLQSAQKEEIKKVLGTTDSKKAVSVPAKKSKAVSKLVGKKVEKAAVAQTAKAQKKDMKPAAKKAPVAKASK